MELTDYQTKVYNAEICPYCHSNTKVVSEQDIYGKTFKGRKIIACANYPKCDAYVGTHENGEPLGRLANRELRQLKRIAHKNFDKLWLSKKVERSECYLWLSSQLNIPFEYTHIGMFGKKTLNKVIKLTSRDTEVVIGEIIDYIEELKSNDIECELLWE